jgi:hypothetical protein
MAPKKRAPKKAKKSASAKKSARGKKTVAKKKPAKKLAPKKKVVAKKKKVGRSAVPPAARAKGDQRRVAPATSGLGEWVEDAGEDEVRPTDLFDDDDLAPDYGGSK